MQKNKSNPFAKKTQLLAKKKKTSQKTNMQKIHLQTKIFANKKTKLIAKTKMKKKKKSTCERKTTEKQLLVCKKKTLLFLYLFSKN